MSTFGDLLRETRNNSTPKRTQADIAKAAGVGPAAVCDWERGHRSPPTRSNVLSSAVSLFDPKEAHELAIAAGLDRGSLAFDIDGPGPRTAMLAELSLALHRPDADVVIAKVRAALGLATSKGKKPKKKLRKVRPRKPKPSREE